MDPKDLKLPEGEYVATLPTGFEKIWKILWAVDPARLRELQPDVRANIATIAINHQITVARSLAALQTAEAAALEETAKQLKLRKS
jgi:hypothetical protein